MSSLLVPVFCILLFVFLSVDGVEGAFHGYDSDSHLLTGLTLRWGERVQSMMLTHMLLYNLTPHTACNMQNGAPVHVAKSTLHRWWKHFEWWGETPVATARRFKYKRMVGARAMTAQEKVALDSIVTMHPAYYLDEFQNALERKCGRRVHVSTLYRVLVTSRHQGGLGYSLKVLTVLAVQADQFERAVYRTCLEKVDDPAQFIFVDECSVGRNASRRRRGYGRRGSPVCGYEVFVGDDNPHLGPKHHFTLIGAVDINGFVPAACGRVRRKTGRNDPDPTRGTVDGERFYQYVVGTLVPTLGSYVNGEPRSVVVMDNATIHKDPRVRAAIEGAGAILIWNAAYSPDLNPIERVFSLYKAFLRRFATEFRRHPELVHHLALDNCVDRKKMCNFYKGKAFEGCIRNVPVMQEQEEDEEIAVVLAAVHTYRQRRQKRKRRQ